MLEEANQNEREDLKVLWTKIRQRLANLRWAECIRRRQKRREKEQAKFFKIPFRFARQLLEKAKSRSLEVTREGMEEHIRRQYNDRERNEPLGPPSHLPQPGPPVSKFDILPPKLSETREVVRKARSASGPGPNGVPYKLYKNCRCGPSCKPFGKSKSMAKSSGHLHRQGGGLQGNWLIPEHRLVQ